MNPEPTPFDIVPIPVFPFVPSIWSWVFLIACALLIYGVFQFFIKNQSRESIKILDLVVTEILNLERKNQAIDSSSAARLSILIRRFLAAEASKFGPDFNSLPSLSAKELESLSKKVSDSKIQFLLKSLADMESIRFGSSETKAPVLRELRDTLQSISVLEASK